MLTDDGSSLTIQMAQALLEQQWQVVVLSFPPSIVTPTVTFPPDINRVTLQNLDELHLQEQLTGISQDYGAIGAFIHLNPINLTFLSAQAIVKQIFLAAKYLQPSLNLAAKDNYGWFVTVSRLDGELGVSQPSEIAIPISGGLFSLTKSLNLEWENVFCRAIDLSPKLDDRTSVKSILAELYNPNRLLVEVGYNLQGRMTLVAEAEKDSELIQENRSTLDRHSVLLVSGGGRGITAQCAITLAKFFQCKFILLGRKSLNSEPEWAKNHATEIDLKRQAIAFLQSQGEKPKPIQVNRLVRSILAQREIKATLQAIALAGGEAIYLSADITNDLKLKEKLTSTVRKFGKITGIIHGAGAIADRLIEQKSAQDFDSVYNPKVIGLQNLLSCIEPSQLEHLILFSSVAGFYGNIGQTDYAIANEILNKFAYNFQQKYAQCQTLSINWGAWDGGMVTPEIKRLFAQRNIDVIPIKLGTKILIDELARKDFSRTQILVGSPLLRDTRSLSTKLKTYYIKRNLTIEANPFLEDHAIGGNPVFPMACAIEWTIKTCEQFYSGYKCFVLNNFKVLKGIIFDGNEAQSYTFQIQEELKQDNEKIKLKITIFRKLKNNRSVYHYSCEVLLVNKIAIAPVYQSFRNKQDPSLINLCPYEDGTLFHRGIFRGITKVLNISQSKITLECASISPSPKTENQLDYQYDHSDLVELTIKSVLADIIMQSGLVWLQYFHQVSALPSRTGEVQFFRDLPVDKIFYVSTNLLSCKNNKLVANIISHDADGAIYCQAFNVEATISKSLKKMFVASSKKLANKLENKSSSPKPILFDHEQIEALCLGSVAKCFGEEYAIYDRGEIKASRLPNSELNLLHRVLSIQGKRHQFTQGSTIVTEYDMPLEPWYYQQNSSEVTPYSILMELGLQPCGFLSAYLGTTLIHPMEDLYFRNLDGEAKLLKNIDLRGKTITNTSTLLTSTNIPGMILQNFTFNLACQGEVFYQGTASFGYFSPQSLTKQIGLDAGKDIRPWYENQHHLKQTDIDLQSQDSQFKYYQIKPHKPHYHLGQKLLDLIHRVKIIPNGGEYEQGYIYAEKEVQPTDWYFKCHFFQDPVMPGSLGVEAILQAMQTYALHLDLGKHFNSPHFTHLEQHQTIWKYRGQIPQSNKSQKVYLEIHLTKVEVTPEKVTIIGNASLWKPNLRIYEVKNIGICITESEIAKQTDKSCQSSSLLKIAQLQINNHSVRK